MYNEKPILRIYKYVENKFQTIAIIDDYESVSFQRSKYLAGDFTIEINYNIANAQFFEKNLFVKFGNDGFDFGVIISVHDSIGSNGKGSQKRTVTGKDVRYIFKRRIIKSLNSEGTWEMTDKGEMILRKLIKDQCGDENNKRYLPVVNLIPSQDKALGDVITISESFTNLYEVLTSIAEGSGIGWNIYFDGNSLLLICYEGKDISSQIIFSSNRDSIESGSVTDSTDSYCNSVYIGGNGQGSERDIYEAEQLKKKGKLLVSKNLTLITENGNTIALNEEPPSGLDRFEAWTDVGDLNSVEEYKSQAVKLLNTYLDTFDLEGKGLSKCPYKYKKDYDVGDTIGLEINGIVARTEVISVTENWSWNNYNIDFEIGKPIVNLNKQLNIMLNQIQKGEKKSSTESVKWYTIDPDPNKGDKQMTSGAVVYNVIGFIGNASTGQSFKLFFDKESKSGSKTYHVYIKQLSGTGKLKLTTGSGKTDIELPSGTYTTIIFVDSDGNISRTI